jgi:putative copper export protein
VAWLAIPEARGGVVAARVRILALPTAAVVAVVAAVEFFAATARSAHVGFLGAFSVDAVSAFLASPPARGSALGGGVTAFAQFAVFVLVALGLVAMSRRPSRRAACAVTVGAALGAFVPNLPVGNLARNALTALHVLGAQFWVGGLLVLAAAGLMGRRDTTARQAAAADWAQVWERFSVVALYAVGAVIVSGAWLSWTHVGTPAQLVTTAYGRVLAVKLVLVIGLMAAGAYNMRVLLPAIRAAQRDGDTRSVFRLAVGHFPAVVVGESVAAIGVLFLVPFLRGSARTEAGWPGAGAFDMTVFASGAVLVALTAAALWAGTREPAAEQPSGATR